MADLDATLDAIDAANAGDPNLHNGHPVAQLQGQRASKWLGQLNASASDELRLAARAHHLRRWELARADYPEGRAGYLRWRCDNKAHQAEALAAIMSNHSWPTASVERTSLLLSRTELGDDAETQTLEDVACLVFVETQFAQMIDRLGAERMVEVVAKTLKKMSPEAIRLASTIPANEAATEVMNRAAAES